MHLCHENTCSQGKAFVATFTQDKAKVTLLDTRQVLRMRQVRSGSGIQYVNAGYHLFSKGKEARIEINNKPAYENCVTP
ncbi:MliC family protein [Phormidesmis priestleyi]|uniref:MliC family protein n=1 Tax=Phormidesmis priestleyi TaxID=268141 RepID=UPI00093304A6